MYYSKYLYENISAYSFKCTVLFINGLYGFQFVYIVFMFYDYFFISKLVLAHVVPFEFSPVYLRLIRFALMSSSKVQETGQV